MPTALDLLKKVKHYRRIQLAKEKSRKTHASQASRRGLIV